LNAANKFPEVRLEEISRRRLSILSQNQTLLIMGDGHLLTVYAPGGGEAEFCDRRKAFCWSPRAGSLQKLHHTPVEVFCR
jgi:hypothetical protein